MLAYSESFSTAIKNNDNKKPKKKICWSEKFEQFKITIIIYHRIIKLNEPLSYKKYNKFWCRVQLIFPG